MRAGGGKIVGMRAWQGPAGLLQRYEAGIVMKLFGKVDEAAL